MSNIKPFKLSHAHHMKFANDAIKAKQKELGRDLTSAEKQKIKRDIKEQVETDANKKIGKFEKDLDKKIHKMLKRLK